MKQISPERYEEARESYEGFCINCNEFTRFETEPDAENYECPECGLKGVEGAEQALLKGDIEIEE